MCVYDLVIVNNISATRLTAKTLVFDSKVDDNACAEVFGRILSRVGGLTRDFEGGRVFAFRRSCPHTPNAHLVTNGIVNLTIPHPILRSVVQTWLCSESTRRKHEFVIAISNGIVILVRAFSDHPDLNEPCAPFQEANS